MCLTMKYIPQDWSHGQSVSAGKSANNLKV